MCQGMCPVGPRPRYRRRRDASSLTSPSVWHRRIRLRALGFAPSPSEPSTGTSVKSFAHFKDATPGHLRVYRVCALRVCAAW